MKNKPGFVNFMYRLEGKKAPRDTLGEFKYKDYLYLTDCHNWCITELANCLGERQPGESVPDGGPIDTILWSALPGNLEGLCADFYETGYIHPEVYDLIMEVRTLMLSENCQFPLEHQYYEEEDCDEYGSPW